MVVNDGWRGGNDDDLAATLRLFHPTTPTNRRSCGPSCRGVPVAQATAICYRIFSHSPLTRFSSDACAAFFSQKAISPPSLSALSFCPLRSWASFHPSQFAMDKSLDLPAQLVAKPALAPGPSLPLSLILTPSLRCNFFFPPSCYCFHPSSVSLFLPSLG